MNPELKEKYISAGLAVDELLFVLKREYRDCPEQIEPMLIHLVHDSIARVGVR